MNFGKLVRPDSFIGRYLTYMSGQETPEAYDFWCALWLMSLAVGRGCVVARPRAPVYMNMYVMLVAESGVTRKSSAVRSATKLARRFIETVDPTMDLLEARTTPEALEARLHVAANLHGHSHLAISVSELVTFLGREKYNISMPGLLTDLYDCPEIRTSGGTINRGQSVLRQVYLSFISASTPSWLSRAVNPDVVEGGFTSRCIFVHREQRKKRVAWPEEIDDAELQNSLIEKLSSIRFASNNNKTIGITANGRKRFENWYRTRPENRDPFRSSFESREDAHVLRVAAFLAINDDAWEIQHNHVTRAIEIVQDAKDGGSKIFAGAGTSSRAILGVDKLRDTLMEAGLDGIAQSSITTKVRAFMDSATAKTALEILHELGMVQKFEVKNAGRTKVIWRGTRLLTSPGAMTTILDRMEPDR